MFAYSHTRSTALLGRVTEGEHEKKENNIEESVEEEGWKMGKWKEVEAPASRQENKTTMVSSMRMAQ